MVSPPRGGPGRYLSPAEVGRVLVRATCQPLAIQGDEGGGGHCRLKLNGDVG